MICKLKDQSDKVHSVWQVGPWYVIINHRTRRCDVTSGDVWFNVRRQEVVGLIKHERKLKRGTT